MLEMFHAAAPLIVHLTGCDPADAVKVARITQDDTGRYLIDLPPSSFAEHFRRGHRYLLLLRDLARTPDDSAALLGWTRREFDRHVDRYLGAS